jgi:amino acid permease
MKFKFETRSHDANGKPLSFWDKVVTSIIIAIMFPVFLAVFSVMTAFTILCMTWPIFLAAYIIYQLFKFLF